MKPWLFIVGIGEDGLEGLSDISRSYVETAEIIIGGKRHLEMACDFPGKKTYMAHAFERYDCGYHWISRAKGLRSRHWRSHVVWHWRDAWTGV